MLCMIDCTRMTIRSIKIKKLRKLSFQCMLLSMLVLYVCLKRRLIQLKQMRSNNRFRQCLHIHISLQGRILIQPKSTDYVQLLSLSLICKQRLKFVSWLLFFLSCRIGIILPVLHTGPFIPTHIQDAVRKYTHTYIHTHI